jgi:hypothetical protein
VSEFTGYELGCEDLAALKAECVDIDFAQLVCGDDQLQSRGMFELFTKNKIRRCQGGIGSCAGAATCHAGASVYYMQAGNFRVFNPMWTYKLGQKRFGARGAQSGTSIQSVVKSGKEDGLLPEDIERDGKLEFPYSDRDYNKLFSASAAEVAKNWKFGFAVQIKSWDALVKGIGTGILSVITGGPWGNWKPDAQGICRKFRSGGGGHARCYNDIKFLPSGEILACEPNSHYDTWGVNGWTFHSREFFEAQLQDPSFVAIGVSDMTLGPDKVLPKPRKVPRFVKFD